MTHRVLRAARYAGVIVFALLAALTPSESAADARLDNALKVVIHNDRGGALQPRLDRLERFRRLGTEVEIRGTCKSACTVYLALERVCVTRDAKVAFHGPQYADGSEMSEDEFEYWTRLLASHYPRGIDSWFLRDARHVIGGGNFLTLRGSELIRFGVRECPPIAGS